jgi:hypothetical protein
MNPVPMMMDSSVSPFLVGVQHQRNTSFTLPPRRRPSMHPAPMHQKCSAYNATKSLHPTLASAENEYKTVACHLYLCCTTQQQHHHMPPMPLSIAKTPHTINASAAHNASAANNNIATHH